MAIRAALFDRDGVLVRVDWCGIYNALISKLPIEPRELDERWRQWTENAPSSLKDGDPESIDAFLQTLAAEMSDPVSREALYRFRLSHFVSAYPDAHPALEWARNNGLRIGVLSNNTILLGTWPLLALVGLDEFVDVALSAQNLGVSKPHPMAYRKAAQALDVELDECLFFDDHAPWVVAARALGIQAYHIDRNLETHCLECGIVNSLDAIASLQGIA